MLKKIASITVAMALAMTSFIGCSSKSDKSVSSSTENAETKAEDTKKDTKKDEIVTLKYYTIGPEPKDKQMVVDKMNEYLGEKIGVNLDMYYIDFGDYNQKTSVMINTGDDFDLMFTSSWAANYLENSRKGAFLDVTPYFENVAKDVYGGVNPKIWEGAKIDGKVYAIPNQKEMAQMPVWVFNKELVDKYNVPYKDLHTLEDLEPYLKIIKENEPNIIPLYSTPSAWAPGRFAYKFFFENIVSGVGVEIDDDTLTVKNMLESKQLEESLNTVKRYFDAGYINKDAPMLKSGSNDMMRFVYVADGQPYADNVWSAQLGYDVVSTPLTKGLITDYATTGSMIAVSANSKHPEKAVEYLNLINTDPYLRNLINYGIEDVHYKKIGENQIKLDPVKSEDYSISYYTLGNLFITYVLDTDPVGKWDEFEAFNDEADVSKILGFKVDTSSISTEIAALGNVMQEFQGVLFSGSVDPKEYIDKANKKLYQQGLQKVIDEVQSQLDEWLKTKQ